MQDVSQMCRRMHVNAPRKGWECGKPEKNVTNRDLVKNAKSKAEHLVYQPLGPSIAFRAWIF